MATRVEDRVATRPVSVKSGGMAGLGRLAGSELRLMRREPGILWVIVLPILLSVVFGLIPGTSTPSPDFGGARFIDFYVPVLVCFVTAMMALNVLASALGTYRERGVLRLLAVTPVRPFMLLLAQGLVNLAVLVTVVVLMMAITGFGFHVPMPKDLVGFLLAFVLTVSSMFAIGLLVAALAPTGRAANGIGTALMFPMIFLAGVWTPGPAMPDLVRRIAEFTPLGAGSQAIQGAWTGTFPTLLQLAVPALYTLVIGYVAVRKFRWE